VRGDGAGAVRAYFNLSDRRQPLPAGAADAGKPLFSSEAARYRGARQAPPAPGEDLAPYECVVFGSASWRAFF
jgi:hypothetical protein